MLQLGGIKKKYKGGHSPSPLSPATYKLGENMASGVEPNFAKLPNAFPSNQVGGRRNRYRTQKGGGGYGFTSGGDVTPFGGSYAPFARYGGEVPDATRGGNNVVQTGGRRRKSKSQNKWRMKGCSRKKRKGGNSARGRGGSTKKKRSTNNRRYSRHKTMRAGCGSCKLSPAPYPQ